MFDSLLLFSSLQYLWGRILPMVHLSFTCSNKQTNKIIYLATCFGRAPRQVSDSMKQTLLQSIYLLSPRPQEDEILRDQHIWAHPYFQKLHLLLYFATQIKKSGDFKGQIFFLSNFSSSEMKKARFELWVMYFYVCVETPYFQSLLNVLVQLNSYKCDKKRWRKK